MIRPLIFNLHENKYVGSPTWSNELHCMKCVLAIMQGCQPPRENHPTPPTCLWAQHAGKYPCNTWRRSSGALWVGGAPSSSSQVLSLMNLPVDYIPSLHNPSLFPYLLNLCSCDYFEGLSKLNIDTVLCLMKDIQLKQGSPIAKNLL